MTDDIEELRRIKSAVDTAVSLAGDEAPPELLEGKRKLDQLLGPVREAERLAAESKAAVDEARTAVENARSFDEQTSGIDLHRTLSTLFGEHE